jgi:hypothetical protein
MKEEWLFPNAIIPVDVETTQALVVEIKRLIDVVGGMALECPNCEYHRQRAQRWREEAYKLSGHPLPEREWIGLTEEELYEIYDESDDGSSPCGVCGACSKCKIEVAIARATQAKLKEKNS